MYNEHFDKVVYFINTYHKLINCHIVDFITDNLWVTCLPETLRSELEKNELNWMNWTENDDYPILNNFMKLAKSLSLQSCSIEINSKDFSNTLPHINNQNKYMCENIKVEFINAKKLHEVESLGNIIGEIAAKTNNLIIDAGAGKAYLSTFLAENHKVPVLAIDSSQLCSNGAICRQKKLQKKLILSPMLVVIIVKCVSSF